MLDIEIRRQNKEAFNGLFDSIGAVLCAASTPEPKTIDEFCQFTRDFVECASRAGGKCLELGISVFSSIINIPSAAITVELQNYKQQSNKENK